MTNNKIYLVTGSTGFVGSKLVEFLIKKNCHVICIYNKKKNLQNSKKITWIKCNLEKNKINLNKFNFIDAVFIASGANSGANLSENDFLNRNEKTLINTVLSVSGKTKKIINVSSQVVYGKQNKIGIRESQKISLNYNPYSISKINAENWLHFFYNLYDFTVLNIRVCGFIEGGGNITNVVNKLLSNKKIEIYNNGNTIRDYISIYYTVMILYKLSNIKFPKNSYHDFNLGCNSRIKIKDIVSGLTKKFNSKSNIIFINKKTSINKFVLSSNKIYKILNLKKPNLLKQIYSYAQEIKNEMD